jgi:hypothetical protein
MLETNGFTVTDTDIDETQAGFVTLCIKARVAG